MSDNTQTPTSEATPVSTPAETTATAAAPAPNFRETGSTTATDLRRELSDVLKFVEGEGNKTVAITRHGKVVAAVVGGTEYGLIQRLKEAARNLAPKLGLTYGAFLDKLATAQHNVDADVTPTTEVGATVTAVDEAKGGFTAHTAEGPGVVQPASFDSENKTERPLVPGIDTPAVTADAPAFES